MNIVVAGANGLIGVKLVQALRARGDTVVALVRKVEGSSAWANGARVLAWDGRSQGEWSASIEAADAVVNLAGAPVGGKRWSDAWKREIHDSRVDSTKALVEAMRASARKPKVFVAGSATGFYGDRGDQLLDETAAPGDDFLARVCRDWEAAARPAEQLGVTTVLLRTGIVLAREGGALQQMLAPFKAFVGGPIGDGKQWFSWIHVDDEVGLILWALDGGARGPVNAVAPGAVTMKGFTRALGRAMHRPSWLPVPAFALRAALGEFATMLTGGQRVVPKAALDGGYRFKFADVDAALADLIGPRKAPAASAEARP